ncbi:MAG: PepSY domain-containing protein [Rhizomicrobium sp.]
MFRRVLLASLAIVALGLSPASAQRYARDNSGVAPLERMLPQIRREYPGTFSDAEGPFPDERGNPHYHIKWLTPDGRVIWLDTDARTGRVLGVNGSGWRTQQYRSPGYNGRYNAPPPGWNGGRNWGNPGGWPDRGNGGNYRGGPPGGGPPGGHWGGPQGGGHWGGGNRGHHGH